MVQRVRRECISQGNILADPTHGDMADPCFKVHLTSPKGM